MEIIRNGIFLIVSFFDADFLKSLAAFLLGSGVVGYYFKGRLDRRLEKYKVELAAELLETQTKARIRTESQIEAIDNLHRVTLVFRDAVSDFKMGKEKFEKITVEEWMKKMFAGEMEEESKQLYNRFSQPSIDFINAISFAMARMTPEQRNVTKTLQSEILSQIFLKKDGEPHKAIAKLREFLESESRRLRDIDK
jgi:hypothetical protein